MSASATSAEREALGPAIESLADNKAALGRRYGEWAVSAPTLESAVAAAAMAQDELGHARASYPLLKQLELEVRGDEDRLEVGGCMPLLASELPSWTWFVAANLVVDGMLSAFVGSARDSAFVPLAQRARKILQEERSHAAHGSAWARRLARDDRQAPAFAAAVEECWRQAARWAGHDDDELLGALNREGLLSGGPGALRAAVREQVRDALAGTGLAGLELAEPSAFAGWSPRERG